MHLLAHAQVFFVDAVEELLANLGGNRLDSLDKRARRSTERNEFGAPIPGGWLAMDQPLRFKTV